MEITDATFASLVFHNKFISTEKIENTLKSLALTTKNKELKKQITLYLQKKQDDLEKFYHNDEGCYFEMCFQDELSGVIYRSYEKAYEDALLEKQPFKISKEYFEDKEKSFVIDINNTDEYEDFEVATVTEHTRAHIKIQDGCNNFCSYCIIPYARGRIRSRNLENIKEEIVRLSEKGFHEVVLTGINLGFYKDEDKTLIDVIEMADSIEGIERIRLGSVDPEIITEEFVARLKHVKKMCPHFHLSMQSGCDNVLKAMNRHYTTKEYFEKCEMLRSIYENPAITTDIIVGFPGETEEDFETTVEFTKKIGFSQIHVFKYSKRNGTRAAVMENQVDEQIKTKRSEVLIKQGEELMKAYRQNYINKKIEVLFEESKKINGKNYMLGHTKNYIEVAVETNDDFSGEIYEVIVQDFLNDEIVLATR